MKTVDWYFDFISPFAYLASCKLNELPDGVLLRPKPVLFAGILQHWNTKGPAEIEPMRQYTFRHVVWEAEQAGIPLTLPPMHPFNPLKLLRLALVLDADIDVVQKIFRFVWEEGCSADSNEQWQRLAATLKLADVDSKISQSDIKQALIINTQKAIDVGVFGVPTFVVDGELFFGQDSMDFLQGYLSDPECLQSPLMQSADALPEGIKRKR